MIFDDEHAGTAVLDPPPPAHHAGGVAARLAREAVRYAATLDTDDRQALTVRLYCYGRLPLTPRWARRFPDHAAVAGHLGLGRGGPLHDVVEGAWTLSSDPAAPDGWLSWARRDAPAPAPGVPTLKLYLSPRPEALPDAFGALALALRDTDATAFKVGRDAHGLLRPDKMVADFPSMDGLRAAALALAGRLRGVPAHGVPFTAPLTPDALLSWGADPVTPPDEARQSWRVWVAGRLAAALVRARAEGRGGALGAARALALVHDEHGVSPDAWEPPAAWLSRGGAPDWRGTTCP
jgi:hypothetical protein